MSAVDGSSPASPPPPPPDMPAEAAGNPWERRDSLGFVEGLIEAVRLFVTSPAAAYEQTRLRGDFLSPLLFAVLMGLVGAIASQLWGFAFRSPFLGMVPPDAWGELGFFAVGSAVGLVVQLVLMPLFVVVALFVWSAIVHGCLVLLGGTAASPSGFEGTFRVLAYSMVSQLASVVPIAGGAIGVVWGIVLGVIGLTVFHRTTQGKALAAILLPLLICCVCVATAGMVTFGGLAAFIAASQR